MNDRFWGNSWDSGESSYREFRLDSETGTKENWLKHHHRFSLTWTTFPHHPFWLRSFEICDAHRVFSVENGKNKKKIHKKQFNWHISVDLFSLRSHMPPITFLDIFAISLLLFPSIAISIKMNCKHQKLICVKYSPVQRKIKNGRREMKTRPCVK